MSILVILLLLLYFAICSFLIFVILIQSGKGGGLSSLAGASEGLSQALGSTSSERTLSRMTTYCAVGFVVLAITISLLGASAAKNRSILSQIGNNTTAPATPLSSQPPAPGVPGAPAGQMIPGSQPMPATGAAPGAPITTTLPATNTPAAPAASASAPAAARGAASAPAGTPAR